MNTIAKACLTYAVGTIQRTCTMALVIDMTFMTGTFGRGNMATKLHSCLDSVRVRVRRSRLSVHVFNARHNWWGDIREGQ
jgi:hypothetical protein